MAVMIYPYSKTDQPFLYRTMQGFVEYAYGLACTKSWSWLTPEVAQQEIIRMGRDRKHVTIMFTVAYMEATKAW